MTSPSRTILPFAVIGTAVLITGVLMFSRPSPKRKPASFRSPLIETLTATLTTTHIKMVSQGTVVPSRKITLLSEVSGKITWVNPQFVPGGRFKKGDVIAKVDARNYETIVAQQEAKKQQALLTLELEKGKKRVAEREWSLLKQDTKGTSPEGRALALREPQLKNAEAAVRAATQAWRRAQLDLARTSLRAPFNAVVLSRNADLGQIVGPNSPIASLAGTDQFWVEANIPVGNVAYLEASNEKAKAGSSAIVTQRGENQVSQRTGRVTRVLSKLDPVGRMARIIIEIDDPLRSNDTELPIFLGAFTEIELQGRKLDNVFELPESIVHTNDRVFVLTPKNTLDIRKVEIAWKSKRKVLVTKGLKAGEKIIKSRVPTPVQGMKLRTKPRSLERKPVPGERS